MGEFATKGLANGVGIPALVLGSLGFLGSANNGNGGILGGILGGGNCNQLNALMAENANLRAEKYSDNKDSEVYVASRAENKVLRDELMGFIRPLSAEAAANRERIAVLETNVSKNAEIADLREKLVRSELGGRIDSVAQACNCGISQNSAAIAALQNTVNGITQTIVPQSVICPPVMPRYNSWTAPTATDTAPATQPISGTVKVQRS
jgi:hypothetical protein